MELQVLAPFEEILSGDVVKWLAESQADNYSLCFRIMRSGEHPRSQGFF